MHINASCMIICEISYNALVVLENRMNMTQTNIFDWHESTYFLKKKKKGKYFLRTRRRLGGCFQFRFKGFACYAGLQANVKSPLTDGLIHS